MIAAFRVGSGDVRRPIDPLQPYFPAVERYLGLSRNTAHRLSKSGEISTIKVGKRVLVADSELHRFIAAAKARTPIVRAA